MISQPLSLFFPALPSHRAMLNKITFINRLLRTPQVPSQILKRQKSHYQRLSFPSQGRPEAMASSRAKEDLGDMPEELAVEEKFHARGNQGGRGRGRGRGGKAGGRGGRVLDREVVVSKALSKLLRHAAADAGIKLDAEGYAPLDQVMKYGPLKSLNITFPDIQQATQHNAKQRFSMKPNPSISPPPPLTSTSPEDWVIRANQGHSIAVSAAALLKPITLSSGNIPDTVVHGTYYSFYPAILASGGLKCMSRTHIHFSTGLPESTKTGGTGVISGMRNDAELLIYVDIRKSLADGRTSWWVSENGVILTEGDSETGVLGTKYWKKVVGRNEAECGVLWEDGVQVADLPAALRNRKPPFGKHRALVKGKGKKGAAEAVGAMENGGEGEGLDVPVEGLEITDK